MAVVCGKGNNGGDGLVVARLLREAGRERDGGVHGAAGRLHRGRAREPGAVGGRGAVGAGRGSGASLEQALAGAAVVVDALLGTGFEGEPRGAVAEAIEVVNAARAPVVSVDVPSGVDASTGVVSGAAVRAAITVTFHARKPGLWIAPGKAHAGEVETVDIGIPAAVRRDDTKIGLIDPSVLDLLPRRGGVLDEVLQRARAARGWLARADGRAADGCAGRDARRSRLRDGLRARFSAGDPRDAEARPS